MAAIRNPCLILALPWFLDPSFSYILEFQWSFVPHSLRPFYLDLENEPAFFLCPNFFGFPL